jgi:hypothetical protein
MLYRRAARIDFYNAICHTQTTVLQRFSASALSAAAAANCSEPEKPLTIIEEVSNVLRQAMYT